MDIYNKSKNLEKLLHENLTTMFVDVITDMYEHTR